jgi:site-specific recombinase XerD
MINLTKVELSNSLEILQDTAEYYIDHSKAPNTIRAYHSDWKHFEKWCIRHGLNPLPTTAATIALYLTYYAESLTVSTLSRKLTTIREAHRAAGLEGQFTSDAKLKALWEGIKRTKGVAQHQKDPLLTEDIRSLVEALPRTVIGVRDRALLLLGFSGAFRRSELVSLDVTDLHVTNNGIEIVLRHSKTDQVGQGTTKAIPFGSSPLLCPVRALNEWLQVIARAEGPLFVSIGKGQRLTDRRLSDKSVADLIKSYASKAGLGDSDYAGHSLRAGFATQAALNGASDRAIMTQTGHRSRSMVDRYVRHATIWSDNGVTRLGL